jgi:predicted N-acetyltransferase YhbS
MSEWDGPRLARPEEFGEAMRFTDIVFRPGQRGRRILQRQYPHAYRDEPAFARRLLLLRHRGQLVGCVAIHPMTLRLGSALLRAGGIGIVGTHPERRGEGIMTKLLNEALARMNRAGYAVSVLGGDRQRYARFGWQNGGVRQLFELTARSLGSLTRADRRLRLERLSAASDAALWGRVQRLSTDRPFAAHRPRSDIRPLLVRNGREAYACCEGRRFAYVVVAGPERQPRPYVSVDEFGGDTELLHGMLRRLMARSAGGRLRVVVGPNPADAEIVQPVSASWSRSCDGMINILSLERLVEQLQPEIVRRAAAGGVRGSVELAVAPEPRSPTPDDSSCLIRLSARGQRRRLRLPAARLVDLFFGCLPLGETFDPVPRATAAVLGDLSACLPLPLHIPPLNHI